MIPTIEQTLADLACGRIGYSQALAVVREHMQLANQGSKLRESLATRALENATTLMRRLWRKA